MDGKPSTQPVEEDEEDGSEYEYEYETDSEEENFLETEEASGTIRLYPVVIEQIQSASKENIQNVANNDTFEKPSLSREQISAMKPKQLLIGSDPSLKHQHMKYIKAIIPIKINRRSLLL